MHKESERDFCDILGYEAYNLSAAAKKTVFTCSNAAWGSLNRWIFLRRWAWFWHGYLSWIKNWLCQWRASILDVRSFAFSRFSFENCLNCLRVRSTVLVIWKTSMMSKNASASVLTQIFLLPLFPNIVGLAIATLPMVIFYICTYDRNTPVGNLLYEYLPYGREILTFIVDVKGRASCIWVDNLGELLITRLSV